MSSGLKAGFLNANELFENEEKVREQRKKSVNEAPDELTGKGAETVYRSKGGKKVNRDAWLDEKMSKRRRNDEEEQHLEWGGGVVQKKNQEEELKEAAKVAAEPLARYKITDETDRELRNQIREDDPMAPKSSMGGESAMDQADRRVKKLRCQFTAPPNRFGIPAGSRWDGKVRGNDYEKRWFKKQSDRKHNKTKDYTWSIEEM
jgi:pre-mRNA-splicing factor CWC26